jgi:hypothetical protein
MVESLQELPEWIRVHATPWEELAAMRAEALAEITAWRRGEPSRVTTFEEFFAWLDGLDAADGEGSGADPA